MPPPSAMTPSCRAASATGSIETSGTAPRPVGRGIEATEQLVGQAPRSGTASTSGRSAARRDLGVRRGLARRRHGLER